MAVLALLPVLAYAGVSGIWMAEAKSTAFSDIVPQISGGGDASIERLPYMVSIEQNGRHICAGSILNARTVLTSATCVKSLSFSDATVRVGTATLGTGGDVYEVSGIAPHPLYEPLRRRYDVAVVQLSNSMAFSSLVRAIAIAEEGDEPTQGDSMIVAGWGTTELYAFENSKTLRSVWVRVMLRKLCQLRQASNYMTKDRICAGGIGGKGACEGDEGGPLVGEDGVQYGVLTGTSCGYAGSPDTYANLADTAVRDWIIRSYV